MSHELHAFEYSTGRPVRVRWNERGVLDVREMDQRPGQELWVAPPLIDLQVNGYAGVDFQQAALGADELLQASRALRRDGCGRFLLTLITDEWPRLMSRLNSLRRLRESSAELRDAIAGWHIEGPFLSDKPGFCGAHDPTLMCDATAEHVKELRAITGDDPVLLTMAPERLGALEAIRLARSLGMRVSLGHTDASAEVLQAAVAAGATGFTHLGNGCPRELDRHDNILFRACDTPGLTVSFIPDGIHVAERAFRLLHKLISGPAYYTTDAMAAAGAGPGRFRLGKLELEVGNDEIVRQPGKTNFAGSALRPVAGVFRAAKMLNLPWPECWRRFAEVPAQFMGVKNEFAAGAKSFCLVRPTTETVEMLP